MASGWDRWIINKAQKINVISTGKNQKLGWGEDVYICARP